MNSHISYNYSLNDFIWTKKTIHILNNMIKRKHLLNIIIYGSKGSGKTTLANVFLMEYFNINTYKLKEYEKNHHNYDRSLNAAGLGRRERL